MFKKIINGIVKFATENKKVIKGVGVTALIISEGSKLLTDHAAKTDDELLNEKRAKFIDDMMAKELKKKKK